MTEKLVQRLENLRAKHNLSILAFCKWLNTSHVNYHRWKKAKKITGPYKKIIEDFLDKNEHSEFPSQKNQISSNNQSNSNIAVIGIACYYPGASNIQELWENILARRVQFRRMLDQRLPLSEYYDADPKAPEKTYLTKAAFLENFQFDWGKLRIPKKTIESSDIAHWVALDTALKTFEDAGFRINEIPLQNTGVIVGNTLTGEQTRSQTLRMRWPYVQKVLNATLAKEGISLSERSRLAGDMEKIFKSAFYPITEDSLAGGLANTIAGRICNYLNLKGGGYIVDGACSSSLLAVATAADALKMGNVDLVLAGGVDISLDPFELVGFAKAGALARDKMSVYDQSANGFLPGEGCGFVLLKRLNDAIADKNYIYGVIKGWGISSDGKGGIMEPSSSGQSFAIGRAYRHLNYKIADVDFVEGHGTGTTKGDRVELEGIAAAIDQSSTKNTKKEHHCGVTSFKSIVGHTKAAAGIGGLIKAILAVNQRILPPTANCVNPNDVFKDKAKSLYPLIQGEVLPQNKIVRAGISSAGFGGINCHVTIESRNEPKLDLKPKISERALLVSQQQSEVFVFTSRTIIHLKKVIDRFKEDLRNISIAEMADLAALLNKKVKNRFSIKVAIVTDSPEHLYDALVLLEQEIKSHNIEEGSIHKVKAKDVNTSIILSNSVQKGRVGFLYPGQGSQRLNMTRVLVERFKWAQDLLGLSKLPLQEHIYKATDKFFTKEDQQEFEKQLADTRITQPAVIVSSLIWSEFFSRLGIEPQFVVGHSLGELTAFYKAGAFNKETLIKFSELRGSLMASSGKSAGSMVSLFCSKHQAEELIAKVSGNITIANVNSPTQIVLSGANKEIEKVIDLAKKEDITSYRLNVSNAFHSSFMKEAAQKILSTKVLQGSFKAKDVSLYSCVSGQAINDKVDLKKYFSNQMVSSVNFVDVIENVSKECDVLIELGPGRVLSDLAKAINKGHGPVCLPVESTSGNDRDLNLVLAEIFVRNISVNWEELYKNRLIKTFIPASRKKFIENQCEHPLKLGNQTLKIEGALVTSKEAVSFQPEEIIPGGLPQVIKGKDNIADLLIDLTHKITGFEKDSITLELRLLDDLNLDSIKAGELIGQAARMLGIAGQVDPSQISHNTLGQISNRLHELADEHGKTKVVEESLGDVFGRYQDKGWVRNFVLDLKPEEITSRNVNQLKNLKNIVLLSENSEDELVNTIVQGFKDRKVKAQKSYYSQADGKVEKIKFDCLIAVLPQDNKKLDLNKDTLKEIIKRFNKISALATSNQIAKDAFVVFVQFGGGAFGENKNLNDIASSCSKSLASTLYLERPDLKVRIIDFDSQVSKKEISLKVIDELQTYDRFHAIAYDAKLNRKVICYENSQPSEYKKRNLSWSAKDIVLVTGGGKGITAQCALEIARFTKAQMVLVGRSPLPENKKDGSNEIIQTLKLFEGEHLRASYYQCDVSDETNVAKVISVIQRKEGKITGFIHGAGLNSLKRLKQSSVTEVFKESLPKIFGAVNVCKALYKEPPKLIVGITSIIGLTGMEGSGWYGLANEVLNLYLHQYKNQNPKTEVVTIAYSVWDEVGMGAKLGSVSRLAHKGIGAIPINEGVKRFRQLIETDPGTQQVIVAARVSGIATWKSPALKLTGLRFIETIKYYLPGVELIAQAQLNVTDDPYLLDHNWKGSLLFPFVFGLEAMVQVSKELLQVPKIDNILATNIQLNKPIIVAKNVPTTIHIRTIKKEGNSKVNAQIYCDLDNYREPYFTADIQFLLNNNTTTKDHFKINRDKTDINVEEDLYGKILFQGKMFHCLKDIYDVEYSKNKDEGYCKFSLNDTEHSKYLTGSPFVLDSVLQSMQLVFANTFSLPQSIDSLFIKPQEISKDLISFTQVKRVESKYLQGNNISSNKHGGVISINNCRLKILEIKEDWPDINQIKNPIQRDSKIFDSFIKGLSQLENLILPKIYFKYSDDFLSKNRKQRRDVVKEWTKQLGFKGAKKINIRYSKNNKPIINSSTVGLSQISISHKNNYLILSLGNTVQGIDIEDIQERDIDVWQALLNVTARSILEQLLSIGVELNIAGTCAWSIVETIYKALGKDQDEITYEKTHNGNYLFLSRLLGKEQRIISGIIELTRGRKKIVTFIANVQKIEQQNKNLQEKISFDSLESLGFSLKDLCGVDADYKGPQDQLVFKCHFPVTFKHNQLLSKNVYFTNYFDFCGTLREYSIFPISKKFLDTAKIGTTSMVTKMTSLDVYNPVQIGDILEGKLWMDGVKGDKKSTMNMYYEWSVINRERIYKVADCRQDTIWIKIHQDGKTEIDEYPSYVNQFVNLMGPKTTRVKVPNLKDNKPFSFYSGDELSIFRSHLPNKFKVFEKLVTATLENSNLLSNIYFASFAKWIGQLSDEYFHSCSPDFYKDYSGQKEIFCSHCSIDFYNEAFPFDQILVEMFIDRVFENGVEVYFEFSKTEKGKKIKKLASARQKVLFVSILNNEIIPLKTPTNFIKLMQNLKI